MKICSFDGCGNKVLAKGLCAGHYNQQNRGEMLRTLQVQYHGFSESKRFMMRVDMKSERECWNWQGGAMNVGRSHKPGNGHGQWRNEAGQHELTHRASWRLFIGPITNGAYVLHKCDNPLCVNPKHLFLGTQTDNCKDMWQKKRGRPGKSVGSAHGCSKLTEKQVLLIRGSGESVTVLAARFSISRTNIYDILKRKIWNHI